jgi:hypothetical protein
MTTHSNPARAAMTAIGELPRLIVGSLAALPDTKWPDRCGWPIIGIAVLYFGGHLIWYVAKNC